MSEPDVGALLSRLMRSFQDELYEALRKRGFADITPRHGTVFAFLDPEGTRASVLASRSGAHKQVIGNLVDELEALGYVTRCPDPRDRRAKLVLPTARGLEQRRAAEEIRVGIESRYAAVLGEAAYGEFLRDLAVLVEQGRARS